MTFTTLERAVAEDEDLLNSVFASIRDLRQDLQNLKQKVRDREGLSTTGDGKTVNSAVSLLETCQKVENRLAEYRKKSLGIARGGYALDLGTARADIGSKLDRIRAAADAGPLSE